MPRILLWSLIAIVAIAPLPLGSNRPLGWSLLSLEVGILLIFWAVHHLWVGHPLPVRVQRIRGPLILFALSCAWVLVQLIPNIPFGLAHPAWQEVNIFFGSDVPERITIDPDQTMTILMRWLAYAGVFWLALQLGRDRAAAKTALNAFAVIAAIYALYGLIALFVLDDTILMYEKWVGKRLVTSTFVNRNSYATFAGLGLIAAAAIIIGSLRRRGPAPLLLKDRVYEFLSQSLTSNAFVFLWFFLSVTALLLTGSRAGALSTFAAFLLLVGLSAYRARLTMRAQLLSLAVLLGAGAAMIGFSGGVLSDRLGEGGDQRRGEIYEQTFSAIEDHAFLGSGLGSFPQLFQLYRETDVLRDQYVARAHNTYLENALELGLPAFLCLLSAFVLLAWQCLRGLVRRSRDGHYAALGLSASALVGIHALVDFSLQIPAVVVAYMFLMGIAVAQSFSSRRS